MISKEALLKEHIPYRVKAIDGFLKINDLLSRGGGVPYVSIGFDHDEPIGHASAAFLRNPLLEMAAVYCRVLLEFMGLKMRRRKIYAVERSPHDPHDDIWIEDMGLPELRPGDLGSTPYGTQQEVEKACVAAIEIAHKAIAHLTQGPQGKPDIAGLIVCCYVVLWLIGERVYKPNNMEPPVTVED
jgi:hypothetical protein